jgi:hypothetical protein
MGASMLAAGPTGAASSRARFAVFALALVSALAARLFTRLALRDVPHVMDEVAYVFEAKLMATGHLSAPVALPRAAFNMWFIDDRVARFSIFPPGWPAVLAVGVRLGLVFWVNPLIHLATVMVVGRAGARLGGPRLAVGAALLYAASPQAVILAGSLMSHTLVAFAASVVTLVLVMLLDTDAPSTKADAIARSRRMVLGAGVALGIAVTTRPLCALVLALPLFALTLSRAPRLAPPILATMAPFVIALGAFNRALTGSALRFPQSAYFDEHIAPANVPFFTYGKGCNALGFGHACDHTVRAAFHGLSAALTGTGDNLRSWSLLVAGPLLVVGVGLALARTSTRKTAVWLVSPALVAFFLYALYWQAGVCYGARFYHAALPAVVLLVAFGLATSGSPSATRWFASPWMFRGVLAAALLFDAAGSVLAIREVTSWSWWGTDDRFANLVGQWDRSRGRALVMVAFGQDDVKSPGLVATAVGGDGIWLLGIRALGALGQNAPSSGDDDVVFAKFHPALVSELAERFPDRKLWLYTAWADRSKDVLEPWSAERFPPYPYRQPADNFDGFRIGPPYQVATPLLREATTEGWPP